MRKITISELAKKNRANGGCFFDRAGMKAAGETLKSFKVIRQTDQIIVIKRIDGKEWAFDTGNFRMISKFSVDR